MGGNPNFEPTPIYFNPNMPQPPVVFTPNSPNNVPPMLLGNTLMLTPPTRGAHALARGGRGGGGRITNPIQRNNYKPYNK